MKDFPNFSAFNAELLGVLNRHQGISDAVKDALARHMVCGAGLALCLEKNPDNIGLAAYAAALATAIDALGWRALLSEDEGGACIKIVECGDEEEANSILSALNEKKDTGLNG